MTLAYAGCRLSEALALTADRVDLAAGVLVLKSLKKRRTGVFRRVPVPPALRDALGPVRGIRETQTCRGRGRSIRLWPWSRMTGWRAVHAVMAAAGLDDVAASAVTAGIPLNLVQKWLSHAQLSTTAVYANAIDAEEKDIPRRPPVPAAMQRRIPITMWPCSYRTWAGLSGTGWPICACAS